jgi:5-methylcytosine-specific restriction enzyme A
VKRRGMRVCAQSGCPRLVENGSRCTEHRYLRPSGRDGSTRQWRDVRQTVLERARFMCELGGPDCTTYATECHHRVPVAAGGNDDPSNLLAACESCHRIHHAGGAAA